MFLITIQSKQGQIIDRFLISSLSLLPSVQGKDDCLTIVEYVRHENGDKE